MEIAAAASSSSARLASRSATSKPRALREIELRTIPARIDGEEHVALFHELTGLEMDGLEMTGNARTQLDGFGGVDATGEFFVFRDELLLDGSDGDLGAGGGAATAAGDSVAAARVVE